MTDKDESKCLFLYNRKSKYYKIVNSYLTIFSLDRIWKKNIFIFLITLNYLNVLVYPSKTTEIFEMSKKSIVYFSIPMTVFNKTDLKHLVINILNTYKLYWTN